MQEPCGRRRNEFGELDLFIYMRQWQTGRGGKDPQQFAAPVGDYGVRKRSTETPERIGQGFVSQYILSRESTMFVYAVRSRIFSTPAWK